MSEQPASLQRFPGGLKEFPLDGEARVPLSYGLQDAVAKGDFDFEPWVKSAAPALQGALPIPSSCGVFRSDNLFRLPEHSRSVCFATKATPIRDVFCVKGMEPFAPDFRSALDKVRGRRSLDGDLNMLDAFILKEDKLPNCLLFDEAHAEASAAAMVHQRLADDGEPLPRLPLPVVLVRLPRQLADFAADEIASRASPSLRRKIGTLAAGGLGAYVYWYPSAPLRASNRRPDVSSAATICDAWIDLAARLLRAGFLPTSAYSRGRGHCCDPRNAVIDGGFADLGSVVPVADVSSEEDVFIALQITINRLAATVQQSLGHETGRAAQFDYVANLITHLVRERLAQACQASGDARLMKFSSAATDLRGVTRLSVSSQ